MAYNIKSGMSREFGDTWKEACMPSKEFSFIPWTLEILNATF